MLEDGRPMWRRRKGAELRPSALALEQAIHDRLPHRALLDILTRTAYLLGWHRHFGPASGSDPKIRDAMARSNSRWHRRTGLKPAGWTLADAQGSRRGVLWRDGRVPVLGRLHGAQ